MYFWLSRALKKQNARRRHEHNTHIVNTHTHVIIARLLSRVINQKSSKAGPRGKKKGPLKISPRLEVLH